MPDATDFLRRIRSLIASGWVATTAPIHDAVVGGLADGLAWIDAQAQAVKAATRRKGATGWLLDIDAFGFFGSSFLRRSGEKDDAWRKRWTDEVFRPRVTRQAISKALADLTGRTPVIFEPWNAGDAGGYGMGGLGYGGGNPNSGISGGYGAPVGGYGQGSDAYFVSNGQGGAGEGAGFYGSLSFPAQIFVTAYRPASGGIPNVSGYGASASGYGLGAGEYADISEVKAAVSDAEIYACVARNAAAGIIPWVAIQN